MIKTMIPSNKLLKWYGKEKRDFPWRDTTDPFKILLAGVMLRKTTAIQVSRLYDDFILSFPNSQSLNRSEYSILENSLRSLGLFRIRAAQIKEMSATILRKYDGVIPNDYDKLTQLKGISDYIANSVLCFGFNNRVPIVDTNVIRIYRRVDGKIGLTKSDVNELAWASLPEDRYKEFNWALLDLAAKVCKSRKPCCTVCPIYENCAYPNASHV